MSDLQTTLRRLSEFYDASYPPSILLPAPTLTTIAPATVSAAAAAISVVCTGTGFVTGAVVLVDGAVTTPTTFQSATQVTLTLYNPTVAGNQVLTVRNPDGKVSGPRTMVVGALLREDVEAMTVGEVKSFVAENPGTAAEVAELEGEGKARVTLLEWLDDQRTAAAEAEEEADDEEE